MKIKILQLLRRAFHSSLMPYFAKAVILKILFAYRKYRKTGAFKCYFPWTIDGKEILVGKPLFKDEKNFAYYAQFYSETFVSQSSDIEQNYTYKTELYKSRLYQNCEEVRVKFKEKSLLPISMLNTKKINETSNSFYLDLHCNGKSYKLENLPQNRYHSLRFSKGDDVTIKSPKDLLVSQPISLIQNKKNKKKLVLVLFVDAFGASLFNQYPIEKLIPNTYKFFKKGVIFKKCYSNAEFTIPSLASMFTGKYVHNNDFFHPRIRQTIGESQKTISQYFHKRGYLTQLISGNAGQSPYQGYCLDFDRTIYKYSLKHYDIVHELIDSYRTFKNRDMFSWLSFSDVHHNLNHMPSFSADVQMSIEGHNYQVRDKVKTPFLNYCPRETERHLVELKKFDFHMKCLYNFIDDNFKEEDILVALVSDHGHSFTDITGKTEPLLRKEKVNVPFMIRGTNFDGTEPDEMIENVDILPTILKFSDIKYDENSIDGKVPKSLGGEGKGFVFSESIYPNQTYKATIKDNKYEAFIEGKKLTGDDGKINLSNYTFHMVDMKYGEKTEDEQLINNYKEKLNKSVLGGLAYE